jgi:DeoR/GlpR family transcriptional regulator of sugar metabolism
MDKAFISCRSVSLNHGVTDSGDSEAVIHRLALQHSSLKYLVMDQTKIGKTSFSFVCNLKEISGLVCDCELSKEWKDKLTTMGLRFY